MFAVQRQTAGSRERKGGKRSPERAYASAPPMLAVQRASCACGGGCPRCRETPPLQTKLRVSEPGDALEQEANRVAEQVLRMSDSAPGPMLTQRETRQTKRETVTAPIVSESTPARSGGRPLDPETRAFFEPRFGYDFSRVRAHEDPASARALRAQAYTLGQDIVFNAGRYTPHSAAGRELLAHELTHVIQQGAAAPARAVPVTLRRRTPEMARRVQLRGLIQRRGESPSCPMPGVPRTATAPQQRNAGYCDAFNCHPTNPWLKCACVVSGCIPYAIEALRGQGWRGALYYWHLDNIVTVAGHTGWRYKSLARAKADFYEDINECFYNNWRLGYAHMYEVGTSPNPAWHTAKTACPIGGEDTRACDDAQVEAEWSPMGCGTGPRSGRAIPFGYDPAWGDSDQFPGFGNRTLAAAFTPEGCSFPPITPAEWANRTSQVAKAQDICSRFIGVSRPPPPPTGVESLGGGLYMDRETGRTWVGPGPKF